MVRAEPQYCGLLKGGVGQTASSANAREVVFVCRCCRVFLQAAAGRDSGPKAQGDSLNFIEKVQLAIGTCKPC